MNPGPLWQVKGQHGLFVIFLTIPLETALKIVIHLPEVQHLDAHSRIGTLLVHINFQGLRIALRCTAGVSPSECVEVGTRSRDDARRWRDACAPSEERFKDERARDSCNDAYTYSDWNAPRITCLFLLLEIEGDYADDRGRSLRDVEHYNPVFSVSIFLIP